MDRRGRAPGVRRSRECPDCGASLTGKRFGQRYSSWSLALFIAAPIATFLWYFYLKEHHPEMVETRMRRSLGIAAIPGLIIGAIGYALPRTPVGGCSQCGWHPMSRR